MHAIQARYATQAYERVRLLQVAEQASQRRLQERSEEVRTVEASRNAKSQKGAAKSAAAVPKLNREAVAARQEMQRDHAAEHAQRNTDFVFQKELQDRFAKVRSELLAERDATLKAREEALKQQQAMDKKIQAEKGRNAVLEEEVRRLREEMVQREEEARKEAEKREKEAKGAEAERRKEARAEGVKVEELERVLQAVRWEAEWLKENLEREEKTNTEHAEELRRAGAEAKEKESQDLFRFN